MQARLAIQSAIRISLWHTRVKAPHGRQIGSQKCRVGAGGRSLSSNGSSQRQRTLRQPTVFSGQGRPGRDPDSVRTETSTPLRIDPISDLSEDYICGVGRDHAGLGESVANNAEIYSHLCGFAAGAGVAEAQVVNAYVGVNPTYEETLGGVTSTGGFFSARAFVTAGPGGHHNLHHDRSWDPRGGRFL